MTLGWRKERSRGGGRTGAGMGFTNEHQAGKSGRMWVGIGVDLNRRPVWAGPRALGSPLTHARVRP